MAKARLEEGTVLDGFTVHELLHKGGMASLWKVTQQGNPAPLLMKVPKLNEGDDPATIVSFEMEQMIMPRLKGHHVPRFVANGDFAVQPYIVMELVEGQSMLPKLDVLPLPVEEVASIGARVATALDSLHQQRVVHLDIKPSNIIERPQGDVVLIDYGLARNLDLPDLMSEEFRLPYGTAPYMAPEQVMGQRNDMRSDIFALGVLMYFFATGVRPFGDPQKLKGLQRRIWRDPVPPVALRNDLPPWLQEVILRCLEVNAARRYPTAAQLSLDLRNPGQVQLTKRAWKTRADGFFEALGRRLQPYETLIDQPQENTSGAADAPIVMVALNLAETPAELAQELRNTVSRILERAGNARLACVNVLKQSRIALDSSLDEKGDNKHVGRIVELKDWARPLELPPSRLSFHVLEASDVAEAILDYAGTNTVDHIVMGARANSAMRKLLGSVAGKVASEAPCTVTVVRSKLDAITAEAG